MLPSGMSQERPQASDPFDFTEQERRNERINHKRFMALLTDEQTNVHHIDLSTNSFGEFLFVTMSRPVDQERNYHTFWGLGLHEPRERWLIDEWRFYETQQLLHTMPQKIAPEDATALVQERYAEISPYATPQVQSKRAQLYEMMADLSDEDGALTELEDLEDTGYFDDEIE
jgi:hypothetical protein